MLPRLTSTTTSRSDAGGYQNWEDVVERNDLELHIQDNIQVLPEKMEAEGHE
jgi:hypothetical protein